MPPYLLPSEQNLPFHYCADLSYGCQATMDNGHIWHQDVHPYGQPIPHLLPLLFPKDVTARPPPGPHSIPPMRGERVATANAILCGIRGLAAARGRTGGWPCTGSRGLAEGWGRTGDGAGGGESTVCRTSICVDELLFKKFLRSQRSKGTLEITGRCGNECWSQRGNKGQD